MDAAAVEIFAHWLGVQYAAAPGLVLGLAVLVATPVLAVAGAAWRVMTRRPQTGTRRTRRHAMGPCEAWLEIGEAGKGQRVRINHGLIRIGREYDNEVCLADDTVHRYHAAVHRAGDTEVVVTDLSSTTGNGVVVNGRRVDAARLKDGDRIELGTAEVVFHSISRPGPVADQPWSGARERVDNVNAEEAQHV